MAVFVRPAQAPVVRMGLENVGHRCSATTTCGALALGLLALLRPGCRVVRRPRAPYLPPARYAYSLGVQALIYGFPYVYGAQTRSKWVTQTQRSRGCSTPGGEPFLARGQGDRRDLA